MSDVAAIRTEELTRIYKIRGGKKSDPKELVALKDVDIQVERGELFGLLGPNGAGKTTLIKVLTTLLAPTKGRAYVAGYDVIKDPHEIRSRINMVSGGEASGYGLLTVRENLWMFSQFYGIPSKAANQRIKELLEIVGLGDRLNTKSSDLSSGMRQKMNIVRGFMTDPEILFLDEPTLGLDVGAARDVRNFIRDWMRQEDERTILLTTHYMVEADELCDRVAIINQGKVLACDTPKALKRQLQQVVIFQLQVSPCTVTPGMFDGIQGVRNFNHAHEDGYTTMEFTLEEDDILPAVIHQLAERDIHLLNLDKRQPSLEDVFVHLVGMRMEEVERGETG
ncbi:MAG TPA: ABC transporter ATP-binding protein [Anaerolineae bacterium]|nr:ABC transporter ATP-binding protein [Anaerolineae bacterium]